MITAILKKCEKIENKMLRTTSIYKLPTLTFAAQ